MEKGKYRHKLAYILVEWANQLVRPPKRELKYNYWPKFRPIDQEIKYRGSYQPDHEFTCGAYSYEHLKSYSEQDGEYGASAKTTVKSFISADGWQKLSDLKHEDGTPYTAQETADMISKDLTLEATRQEQKELNNHEEY